MLNFLNDLVYEASENPKARYTISGRAITVSSPSGSIRIPSLKTAYLNANDPQEVLFSIEHIGSFEEWETLANDDRFKETVKKWRRELNKKIRGEAFQAIITESRSDTKNSYAATKFLAEGGWIDPSPEDSNPVGRPFKKPVEDFNPVLHNKKIKDDFDKLLAINTPVGDMPRA